MEKACGKEKISLIYDNEIMYAQLMSLKEIIEEKLTNFNFYNEFAQEKCNNILIPMILSLQKMVNDSEKIKNTGENLLNQKIKEMIANKSCQNELGFSLESVQNEVDNFLNDTKIMKNNNDLMMNMGDRLHDILQNHKDIKNKIEEVSPAQKLSLTNFLKTSNSHNQREISGPICGRNNIEPEKESNLHRGNHKFDWGMDWDENAEDSDDDYININDDYRLLPNRVRSQNIDGRSGNLPSNFSIHRNDPHQILGPSNNSIQRNSPHQFLEKKRERCEPNPNSNPNSNLNVQKNEKNEIPNNIKLPKVKTIYRQTEEEMIGKLKDKYNDKFSEKKFTKKFVNTLMKKTLYEKKFIIGKEKIYPLGNINYKYIKMTITAASPHVLTKDSQLITMLRGFFKDYIYSFHFNQNQIIFGGIFSSGMKFASFIEFLNNSDVDKMYSINEVFIEVYSYFPDLFVEILHNEQYETNINDVFFGTIMDEFTLFQDMRKDIKEITINKQKSANEKFIK